MLAMDENKELLSKEHNAEINCEKLTQTEQRSLLFHILYAVDAYDYDVSLDHIVDNFLLGYGIIIPKESSVYKQAHFIIENRTSLDALLVPYLQNWSFERLGVATRLILRQSIAELNQKKSEPAVVINEAIELAKCFAEKDAYKFINGILDEYVKKAHPVV